MTNSIPQRHSRQSHPWRILVIGLILLLSAWIQITVVTRTRVDSPIRADAIHYVSYAWNLHTHHVFSRRPTWANGDTNPPSPDKMTLPGYPAFLSILIDGQLDVHFLQRTMFAQAALGIATCALVLLTAMRLLPFGWASATGILTAISPHLATISTYLLTEALFTSLVAASMYALVRVTEKDAHWLWAATAGLALGLASMVRPQLELVPFVLFATCVCIRALRPHLRAAALGLLCFLALVTPWQLRNASVERNPSDPDLLVSTLYNGSFPNMMYQGNPASYGFPYRFDPDKDLHSHDLPSTLTFISRQFGEHPLQMSWWYLAGKPRLFLSWGIIAGMGDVFIYPVTASPYLQSPLFRAMRQLVYWLHWPMSIAALCALVLLAWRPGAITTAEHQRSLRTLALVFTIVLLMHMIGTPLPRYGIPFRPLVYILGMAMLHGVWQWRQALNPGGAPNKRRVKEVVISETRAR